MESVLLLLLLLLLLKGLGGGLPSPNALVSAATITWCRNIHVYFTGRFHITMHLSVNCKKRRHLWMMMKKMTRSLGGKCDELIIDVIAGVFLTSETSSCDSCSPASGVNASHRAVICASH